MNDYSIETLITVFAKHAKDAEESQLVMSERFRKLYPDQELPDNMKETFNIAKAFHEICKEISRLRNSTD